MVTYHRCPQCGHLLSETQHRHANPDYGCPACGDAIIRDFKPLRAADDVARCELCGVLIPRGRYCEPCSPRWEDY